MRHVRHSKYMHYHLCSPPYSNTRGASVVLSTQVGVRQQSTQSQALLQEPVALTFNFDDVSPPSILAFTSTKSGLRYEHFDVPVLQ